MRSRPAGHPWHPRQRPLASLRWAQVTPMNSQGWDPLLTSIPRTTGHVAASQSRA